MSSLSDSQRKSEIARRVRSIQSGSILSKKKVITAHERYIRERQARLKERIALQRAMHKLQAEAAAALLKDNPSLRSTSEAARKLMRATQERKLPILHIPRYNREFPPDQSSRF